MQSNSGPITGNTIRRFSGGYFDFADPESTPVSLVDIAVGLSNTCRFAGQLNEFYSVAEHSIHCLHVANEMGCSLYEKRAVFMHDAAEAFVGDVPKPLKIMLPGYKQIEKQVEAAIFKHFDIVMFPVVKEIDLMLLRAEKEHFFGKQDQWHDLDGVKDCSSVVSISCMKPKIAKSAFMAEAYDLGLSVNE